MTDLESRLKALLTPNADGLLPCPWCHRSPIMHTGYPYRTKDNPDDDRFIAYVACNCGATGRPFKGVPEAKDSWNSRPLARALVEAVKQRSHGYRYVWDVLSDRHKAEIGQWFERDDAKILAILDGRERT